MGRKKRNSYTDITDLRTETGFYCSGCGRKIEDQSIRIKDDKYKTKYQNLFINVAADVRLICHYDCKHDLAKKLRNRGK